MTHSCSLRRLLDSGRQFEGVKQVNPFGNIPRIDSNSDFVRRRKMSRVPGKASKVSNIVSVLKPTQVDWASSLR